MNGLAALFIISPPMQCADDCRSCSKQKQCRDNYQKYEHDKTEVRIMKNNTKNPL